MFLTEPILSLYCEVMVDCEPYQVEWPGEMEGEEARFLGGRSLFASYVVDTSPLPEKSAAASGNSGHRHARKEGETPCLISGSTTGEQVFRERG